MKTMNQPPKFRKPLDFPIDRYIIMKEQNINWKFEKWLPESAYVYIPIRKSDHKRLKLNDGNPFESSFITQFLNDLCGRKSVPSLGSMIDCTGTELRDGDIIITCSSDCFVIDPWEWAACTWYGLSVLCNADARCHGWHPGF